MDLEKEIIETKTVQGTILQILKENKNEFAELRKDFENMRKILIGNGKPEESFVFRLKKIEDIEKNCIITQLKNRIMILIVSAIAGGVLGLLNIIWTFVQKKFTGG